MFERRRRNFATLRADTTLDTVMGKLIDHSGNPGRVPGPSRDGRSGEASAPAHPRVDRRGPGPRLVTDSEPPPLETVPGPPAWARASQAQFARALSRLPPDFRAVFELHALRGQSYDEIAARLGVAKPVVGRRLFRARSMLKEALLGLLRQEEVV
jgi:RNA polymerase sigma factor (sigma-70 family)